MQNHENQCQLSLGQSTTASSSSLSTPSSSSLVNIFWCWGVSKSFSVNQTDPTSVAQHHNEDGDDDNDDDDSDGNGGESNM